MISLYDLYKQNICLAEIDLFVKVGALTPVWKSGKRCFKINNDIFRNYRPSY